MGITKQRTIIRKIIDTSDEHLSAEQIFLLAQTELPCISRGTVYRNLGLMAEGGDIRRVSVPGSYDRFDKTTTPHGHFFCVRCGKVFDLELDNFYLGLQLAKTASVKVIDYELVVRCLCKQCMHQGKEAVMVPPPNTMSLS